MNQLSMASLFSDFQARKLSTKELEDLIENAVYNEYPYDNIESLEYSEDGISVHLKSGIEIEVEIDWNEIILN